MNPVPCHNCGWQNAPASTVCERCAAPLQYQPAAWQAAQQPPGAYPPQPGGAYPPQPPKKGLGKGVIAILVVAGLLVVSVPVIGIVAAIAIPSFLAARRAANEASAVGTLRRIGTAEATFIADHDYPGTLAELAGEGRLDPSMQDGVVQNEFRLRQVRVDRTRQTFEFAMEPLGESQGSKAFNICEDFTVRYAKGLTAPAGRTGTPLGQVAPPGGVPLPPPPVEAPPPPAPAPPPPTASAPTPTPGPAGSNTSTPIASPPPAPSPADVPAPAPPPPAPKKPKPPKDEEGPYSKPPWEH